MTLHTIYNLEDVPANLPALFLAGPTPRSADVASWRPQALEILQECGYNATVIIPEDRGFHNRTDFDYAGQIEWERACILRADAVLFWVPRDLADMPAFTTNIEFGMVSERGQPYVLGYPEGAPKMRYLDHVARSQGASVLHDLRGAVHAAAALAHSSAGLRRAC